MNCNGMQRCLAALAGLNVGRLKSNANIKGVPCGGLALGNDQFDGAIRFIWHTDIG